MAKKIKPMSKTFVIENQDYIFVPNPEPVIKKTEEGTSRYCSCVNICPLFSEYPVDRWGRKIIPVASVCPYVSNNKGMPRFCGGDFIYYEDDVVKGFTYRGRGIHHLYKLYKGANKGR